MFLSGDFNGCHALLGESPVVRKLLLRFISVSGDCKNGWSIPQAVRAVNVSVFGYGGNKIGAAEYSTDAGIRSERGNMVIKSECGVWMHNPDRCESFARMVAIDAIRALGLDASDFRKRDAVITAISPRLQAALDEVSLSTQAAE